MQRELLTSKVLIHETDEEACAFLKNFCRAYNLTALRDSRESVIDVFKRNNDMGAAFVAEGGGDFSAYELAKLLREHRPEIPVFLRLQSSSSPVPAALQKYVAGVYLTGDEATLGALVDRYLFCKHYPVTVIRGMQTISTAALASVFKGFEVEAEMPYLVNDQYISGELFSLIPLESDWCRGFMMLQTNEAEIAAMLAAQRTSPGADDPDFREVNQLLAELTNLIWGDLKAQLFNHHSTADGSAGAPRVHVPIIVNYQRKFIAFGNNEPYLCFRYNFVPRGKASPKFSIYQKIAFTLSWEPEGFSEDECNAESMVKKGELEFF